LAIPLNPYFSFFKKNKTKKLGQLCCIYGQLSEFERVKIKSPSILGAISLPIWSLARHHRMSVHPPIPTHMHQNVRIDCNNNFVSRVKICKCFSQNESSKLNQWIQWFYKNIWFKKSKIVNQNLHALKKLLLKIKKISHVSQNFMHQHKVMHSYPSGKVKPAFKTLKNTSCIHRYIQSKGKS